MHTHAQRLCNRAYLVRTPNDSHTRQYELAEDRLKHTPDSMYVRSYTGGNWQVIKGYDHFDH